MPHLADLLSLWWLSCWSVAIMPQVSWKQQLLQQLHMLIVHHRLLLTIGLIKSEVLHADDSVFLEEEKLHIVLEHLQLNLTYISLETSQYCFRSTTYHPHNVHLKIPKWWKILNSTKYTDEEFLQIFWVDRNTFKKLVPLFLQGQTRIRDWKGFTVINVMRRHSIWRRLVNHHTFWHHSIQTIRLLVWRSVW